MSLRSHLIHDHGVRDSDLNQIIQAVIYYSNTDKSKNMKEKQYGKQNIRKILRNDDASSGAENFDSLAPDSCEDVPQQKQESKTVVLPQFDISQNRSEKMFNSLMKQPNPVTNATSAGEKFSFWKPLISHLWRLHKIDMDLYACDKCEYKTYSLAKLNSIHKLIHSEVRGYACDICNKAFKNAKQLRNHKMTHKNKIDKLLHTCEACQRRFSDKRQLRVHMDVVHKKIRRTCATIAGTRGPPGVP
ncbi:hypothetical protein NQ318_005386 [Aromia moschata]|uniref:C2H2-type domain-containing protein n=1 Tax=Aromia moschata TaxID=1265417 RepID=A0AAV8YW72_9CUCU|nr:hypothetical protein NQ318_005386 [Aromia moschata]